MKSRLLTCACAQIPPRPVLECIPYTSFPLSTLAIVGEFYARASLQRMKRRTLVIDASSPGNLLQIELTL